MNGILRVDGVDVPIGTHEGKTIVIGADHRGFAYKTAVKEALAEKGYQLIDVGTNSPAKCDYPIISHDIGKAVSEDPYGRVGIGLCGSGIGIIIPASKHKGVYAARCVTPMEAEGSRRHNNSNLLGIGADYVDLETAILIIEVWLKTPFYASESEKPYLNRFVQTVKLERE
jgi:ribose 5-phosphate isomerase B